MAVHTAISFLSAGIGLAFEIYETVVGAPPSITIYPVDIISRPLFLTIGADTTCCPINNSELRPLIKERYNKASAYLLTCEGLPGNNIVGIEQFFLISCRQSSR